MVETTEKNVKMNLLSLMQALGPYGPSFCWLVSGSNPGRCVSEVLPSPDVLVVQKKKTWFL